MSNEQLRLNFNQLMYSKLLGNISLISGENLKLVTLLSIT